MLHDQGVDPQRVYCSAALRTRQTWELVSNGLELDASFAEIDEKFYAAAADTFLDVIRGCGGPNEPQTVLLVGHEPVMSSLAAHLAGPGSVTAALDHVRMGLPTAGFAILESETPWAQWGAQNARLVSAGRAES